jgi:hypothetical protein
VSRETILGLIGELTFIRNWLNTVDSDHKIWVGPFGESKDFIGETKEVEVKVCGNRTGPLVHKISSIDQLQKSPEKDLYLYSLRVTLGHNKKNKVQDLIEEVRTLPLFCRNLASVKYFAEGILRYGLHGEVPLEYSTFEVLEEGIYGVGDDFPKLAKESIAQIPEVVSVQYSIDITGREPDLSFENRNNL